MSDNYWNRIFYEVKQLTGMVQLQDVDEFDRVMSIIEQGLSQFYYPAPTQQTGGMTHMWSFLRTVVEEALASGEAYHDLPTDWATMNGDLHFTDTAKARAAELVDIERMQGLLRDPASGRPRYYGIEYDSESAAKMALWPNPDKEYTVRYRYERYPELSITEIAEGEGTLSVTGTTVTLSDTGAFASVVAGQRVRVAGQAVSHGVLVLEVLSVDSDNAITLEYDEDVIDGETVDYLVCDAPKLAGEQQHFKTILGACLAEAEGTIDEVVGPHQQRYLVQLLPASITRDMAFSRPRRHGRDFDRRMPRGHEDSLIYWDNPELE